MQINKLNPHSTPQTALNQCSSSICSQLDASIASTHGKLATLHLQLVLLQLSGLLLLLSEQGSVFLAAGAALLDAAEGHDAEEQEEEADGAGDDADFGALGEGGPAVADAGGGLDFREDFGRVFCAAT